jgi:hypothetical protein
MQTDRLIETLSRDLTPVGRGALAARLFKGILDGLVPSFLILWLWLGFRPDLAAAMATGAFWMKFGYTLAVALLAFWLLERLARPGAAATRPAWASLVPLGLLAALALAQWTAAPQGARMALLLGHSHLVCPRNIVVLALPILAGTLWSTRSLAATRPVVAGAAAGLLAGALGAFVYAFHCDESAAPFVVVWYTLGIAIIGAAGGALGRFVLRW